MLYLLLEMESFLYCFKMKIALLSTFLADGVQKENLAHDTCCVAYYYTMVKQSDVIHASVVRVLTSRENRLVSNLQKLLGATGTSWHNWVRNLKIHI